MDQETQEQIEADFDRHLQAQDWQGAMTALVNGYGDEVLRFLGGFLRDGEAAEEVFARLCLKLCEDIEGFRGECSGRTWFFFKARYAALDWRRSLNRKREDRLHTNDLARLEVAVDQIRSRTQPYLRTDVKDRFSALRQQLDPEEQTLLVLYKYQDMSSQEVAEAMSSPDDLWTPAKVRKRWQRLKARIAAMAAEQGLLDLAEPPSDAT